jgi:prepilin-type N-terminal cleavage/methylation domain-containing protein
MKTRQTGFTLVEIAIVLVIIGLLLGGILKGQEMVTQAKIKNVIADFNGISAAQYGYQDRYRALPGDDVNAAGRWPAANPPANLGAAIAPNGDGIITGLYNNLIAAPLETNMFWNHLRLAGFVAGTGGGQPTNAVTGMLGVQSGGGGGAGSVMGGLLGAGGFTGLIICSANLPDKVAIAVDTQLDDGVAATGQVRAMLQDLGANQNLKADISAQGLYQETGTQQYVICKSL